MLALVILRYGQYGWSVSHLLVFYGVYDSHIFFISILSSLVASTVHASCQLSWRASHSSNVNHIVERIIFLDYNRTLKIGANGWFFHGNEICVTSGIGFTWCKTMDVSNLNITIEITFWKFRSKSHPTITNSRSTVIDHSNASPPNGDWWSTRNFIKW